MLDAEYWIHAHFFRFMKRYLVILNILLITTAVFFVVKMFYKVATANIEHLPPLRTEDRRAVPQEVLTRHPLSDYRAIGERNLFKIKTGPGGRSERLDIENLKPTDLKLKLLGTVTGDKKEDYAVIEDTVAKRQDLYRIGDTIQDATLKMILREKVVFHVNGQDEVLEIEKVPEQRRTRRFSPKSIFSGRSRSQNINIKRSQIETAVKDVNSLIKQVRIRPHFTNGKSDGLRFTGIRPNSIFYNMGLKNGDIIIGVDGKKIESVDDALKFYQSLQSASKVQLELKRRGRRKTIDYNIE